MRSALVSLAFAVCPLALGQAFTSAVTPLSSGQLRLIYLECARRSELQPLPVDLYTFCSDAAKVLRDRDFGGDFDAQIAWWHSARSSHAAALACQAPCEEPSICPRAVLPSCAGEPATAATGSDSSRQPD